VGSGGGFEELGWGRGILGEGAWSQYVPIKFPRDSSSFQSVHKRFPITPRFYMKRCQRGVSIGVASISEAPQKKRIFFMYL